MTALELRAATCEIQSRVWERECMCVCRPNLLVTTSKLQPLHPSQNLPPGLVLKTKKKNLHATIRNTAEVI